MEEDGFSLLWESKPKIIHIDVLSYPPEFDAEQAEKINKFLEDGGGLALGILPNIDDGYSESVVDLFRKNLTKTLVDFQQHGVDSSLLTTRSMVSTQCGLSRAGPEIITEIHKSSQSFSQIFKKISKQYL
jgi:hypothetical protein